MPQTGNIDNEPNHLNSNHGDTLEFQNIVQNDIFMPKIGTKLNEIYMDDNHLASEMIYDETTVAVIETPFDNHTSNEGRLKKLQSISCLYACSHVTA